MIEPEFPTPPEDWGNDGEPKTADVQDWGRGEIVNEPGAEFLPVLPARGRERPPEKRFADVRVFHCNRGEVGSLVRETESLVLGKTYAIEFAIRSQRIGIGVRSVIKPVRIPETKGKDDVIVALWTDSEAVEILEPVQTLNLPTSGNSPSIYFQFETLQIPATGCVAIEVRVYYRLNLMEYLSITAKVIEVIARSSRSIRGRTQRISQRRIQRSYDRDLWPSYLPRDLHIHITKASDEYYFTFTFIAKNENLEPIELHARTPVTPEDLREELERIRAKWLECALEKVGSDIRLENAKATLAFRQLAEAGADLWAFLFRRAPAGGAFRSIERQLINNPLPEDARIQITMDRSARDFVFPWSLLYDQELSDADANPKGFWGLRYVIEQQSRDGIELPDRLGTTKHPPLELSFFLYDRLTYSSDQKSMIACMVKDSAGRLIVGPPIESRAGLVNHLKSCNAAILYFFCHGFTLFSSPTWLEALRRQVSKAGKDLSELASALSSGELAETDSWIKLTKSKVTLRELNRLSSTRLKGKPIVFLNMCESAQVLPRITDSFVGYFLREGARSVLGTECPIPPGFADSFARDLLGRLFNGHTLGKCVLDARRKFAWEYANPLGLAYTLWGSTTVCHLPPTIPAGETAQ
jgi:hypothetical protein